MSKVSVVIPTYNRAHLVAEAIQSVLDQSYQDFEIIVIDDGSTDNTKEIVDSFKDPRIKYIYQENRGVSAARNTGIKASNGVYVAFLDSDDVLMENALGKQAQVLDSRPEVGYSYGQTYVMDEKGHVFNLWKKMQKRSCILEGDKQIMTFLIHGNTNGAGGTMARQSCLYEVGLFDLTLRYGSEDFDLWVRLAKKYKVAYIAEPLVKYRVHSSNMSGSRGLDEIEKSNGRVLEGVFNDTKLGTLLSHQRSKAYFHLNLRMASYAYGKREMKAARRYLFRALKMYPKEFIKGLWLPWILQFAKTWLPLSVLSLARKAKRYLRTFT